MKVEKFKKRGEVVTIKNIFGMQVPGFGPGSKAWKASVLGQTTLHLPSRPNDQSG